MYLSKITVHGFKAAHKVPLECVLPGRFAVLAGANSSGKSTIVDSIVLAHHDVFPFTSRPASATLSRSVANRTVGTYYELEPNDTSPLGLLCKSHIRVPEWITDLSSSMGRISVTHSESQVRGQLPVLYLSPTRNPAVDLAGREARLIVELLRAQAFRDTGDKSLKGLRAHLSGLIGSVVSKWPVAAAEQRVTASLAELTDGVSGHIPFLGTTTIDDTFLARVFEFFLATFGAGRGDSHRVETEGLGYANLLQLAVVLAAIPDLTNDASDEIEHDAGATDQEGDTGSEDSELDDIRTDGERRAQMAVAEERRELDDDTFFARQFHALVVLEEPEAHLHPQLQHAMVCYLKEVVEQRPEVQVILTTHSDEIIAACDPEDLVIFCRNSDGDPVARTVKSFGMEDGSLAQARRHLDVTRSASLFADRVVLVEGITDAIVLRALARIWAGDDRLRRRFVDALTITVMGSRVGPWLPDLLTHKGSEIVTRFAILRDSDGKDNPDWVTRCRNDHFEVFLSEPTLEPSLTKDNEGVVTEVLAQMKVTLDQLPIDDDEEWTLAERLGEWFKETGKGRKVPFADIFSDRCSTNPAAIKIPLHIEALLEFVWDGFLPIVPVETDDAGEG